jgi:dTMP kinase
MLIVIEGLDGSGKQTQAELLAKRLKAEGRTVQAISYPNYATTTGSWVRHYLNGGFGDTAMSVNPYAASALFGLDRFADKENLTADYIISDRYAQSNLIYQGAKLAPQYREDFWRWAEDFEYNKLGIPRADIVIFLDVPLEISKELRANRTEKFAGSDIHENDGEYLECCYAAAEELATYYNWHKIYCVGENGALEAPETINDKIYEIIKNSEVL